MVDPVCQDLATKAELNELKAQINALFGASDSGIIDVLNAGSLANTFIQNKIDSSIKDIQFEAANVGVPLTVGGLAALNWVALQADDVIRSIPSLGRVTTAIGASLTQVNATISTLVASGALLQIMGFLANAGLSLVLNISTVNVLGGRMDAIEKGVDRWDADYTNLLNLYSKFQGQIDDLVVDLEDQNQAISNQQDVINQQTFELDVAQQNIIELEQQAQEQRGLLDQLSVELELASATIEELKADFEAYQMEADEQFAALSAQVESLQGQLNQATVAFDDLFGALASTQVIVSELYTRVDALTDRVTNLEIANTYTRAEFIALKLDLEEERDITNDRLTALEAKIILDQRRRVRTGGGGVPQSVYDRLTSLESLDFAGVSERLTDLEEIGQLTDEQYTALLSGIGAIGLGITDLPGQIGNHLTPDFAGVTSRIDTQSQTLEREFADVKARTAAEALANAAEQGVCQSTSPNGCLSPNGNWARNLGNTIKDNIGDILGAVNAALNTAMLPLLNSIKTTGEAVSGKLDTLGNAFNTFKEFSEKAWNATQIDKILAVANFVTSTHNAMMLSRNLGESIGDAASAVLQFVGVKAPTGEPIDVNEVLGKTLTEFLNEIFGAANVKAATATFAKYNRILTALVGTIIHGWCMP
jgi:peptidoglycan hydrolase CwlO-like protein